MKLVLKQEHINQEDGTIKKEFLADIIAPDGSIEARIDILDLRGCNWLVATPALLKQLGNLENKQLPLKEFDLIWPRHFGRDKEITKVKERLNNTATTYQKSHPHGAPNFIHMMNLYMDGVTRYYNEDSPKIVEEINKILDIIQKNPECLDWIDEIAEIYTGGCINQPVAGFFRIASWLAIEDKDSIEEKIDAARQLMIMDEIINLVETRFGDVDEVFKAEVCNILLREVYKDLSEKGFIKEKWIGVPENIHNQEIVSGLTKEMFETALRLSKDVMKKSIDALQKFICGTMEAGSDELKKVKIFGKIAFVQEVKKIEEKYEGIKITLQELTANNDPIPDDLLPKPKDGIASKQPENRSNFLEEKYKSLNSDKQKEIDGKVNHLTTAELFNNRTPHSNCCASIFSMVAGIARSKGANING